MATIIGPQTLKPISENWSSLEELGLDVLTLIQNAMDREEKENHQSRRIVPIGLIDEVWYYNHGIEIDCGNDGQYRLGRDGYIY
jgi:hypothetical protein